MDKYQWAKIAEIRQEIMPLLIEHPLETDDIILGDLPDKLRHPVPEELPLVHTPKPFIAPPVMDTVKPVVMQVHVPPFEYQREPEVVAEPTRWQRIRAWWAANLRDIKALGGGIGIMLLIYAVLVGVAVL